MTVAPPPDRTTLSLHAALPIWAGDDLASDGGLRVFEDAVLDRHVRLGFLDDEVGAPRSAHFIVEKAEANVPVEDRIFEYPQATVAREIVAGPDRKSGV